MLNLVKIDWAIRLPKFGVFEYGTLTPAMLLIAVIKNKIRF